MKLTDRLKVEHGVFLRQLRQLERLMAEGASPDVLRAALEMVACAEEHHGAIEDSLLYPAVMGAIGRDVPQITDEMAEHLQIRAIVNRVRAEPFDAEAVLAYVTQLRSHLEREIHGVFPLAEQVLSEERLHALCRWDEEHIYETTGNLDRWKAKHLA